ncbi:methylated-DNA--protein-cysteine methyltransferase [Strongylocentrotus purpuratus]|uniref:Methylated-DNA--protein-cysteine methyltransferase n=1 Tax=Strongylocentrotus purpuratus TaxID=7668 RepID=A0A7M7GHK7_STRPU|nr:methylated-DNA--protein-cysteine methyltransferase [Strongylocentrotus purpuratus]
MPSLKKAACDLATVVLATPIGHVTITGCEVGVHKICLTAAKTLPQQSTKIVEVHEEPSHWSASLKECSDWLKKYFENANTIKGLPLPPLHITEFKSDSFSSQVWTKLASDVPAGQTVTYGELAAMLDNPKGARAVGGAMRNNPTPLVVPCHRVLGSGGKLGGFMSDKGIVLKEWLLKHEGASY